MSFLEYWLADMIQIPFCWAPEKAISLLLIPLLFSSAILLFFVIFIIFFSSLIGGYLSDKFHKRKPLVSGACIFISKFYFIIAMLMSVCAIILACLRGQYAFIAAIFVSFSIGFYLLFFFIFLGIGFGSFCAIDFAMVIDVLQNKDTKAKDLAVWHQV